MFQADGATDRFTKCLVFVHDGDLTGWDVHNVTLS
jgi:hypothetical protein